MKIEETKTYLSNEINSAFTIDGLPRKVEVLQAEVEILKQIEIQSSGGQTTTMKNWCG